MEQQEEKLWEKGISSTYLYRGKIINLRRDQVLTPGGKEPALREIVEHPGAVAVLVLDQEDRILLVKQYRHAASRILLEVPAGKLEPGEEPLACARRELAEETGCLGGEWKELAWFYTSPGFCDEKIYLFLARGVSEGPPHPDGDEALEPFWLDLAEAQRSLLRGGINDAKTIAALHFAAALTA